MGKEYVATKKNGHNNRFTLPNYVIRRLKIKPDTLFKIDIDEEGNGIIVLTPVKTEDARPEESSVE